MNAATPPLDEGLRASDAPMPQTPQMPPAMASGGVPRLVFTVFALAALAALLVGLVLWQKLSGMQEQLARQSSEALAQSAEARALARQASETVMDAAAKLALMETRVAELAAQRVQVDELIQNLSRSRDDSLVVDIDAALRLALQQAQAMGNAGPLLAALKAGEQRIVRAGQPRLAALQRAMQRDADRLRAGASNDGGEALQRIDQLLRTVEDLPVLNEVGMGSGDTAPAQVLPADAPWWQRMAWSVRQEARSLLRVSRIDQPEAVLLAPEQTYFLRENLKLRLLSARLSLLARQAEPAQRELAAVTVAINRYFDPASRRTQTAATLLQQIQAQARAVEPPQIDETLAVLSAVAAGR